MTNDYHKSRTNAPQQGADRSKLTIGEIATLQEKIIPTARGWVRHRIAQICGEIHVLNQLW